MQRQTVAEINLAVLRANYRALSSLAGPARMILPVKADAYGHGAAEVARCLADEPHLAMFAVVALTEALELRRAGISRDILVMGVVDPARVAEAVARNVIIALHSADHARLCAEAAQQSGGPRLRCHVKADTGMHRLGAACEDVPALLAGLRDCDAVAVEGLMAHLSHADEADLATTESQLAMFRRLVGDLERRGLRPPMVHLANSAALMRCPGARFDAVRPGLALYGISPCPSLTSQVALQPVLTLRTVVALVRAVPVGQGVSYGHTWRAERPSRVAALPIGYGDGYRRGWGNRAQARVEGRLAPVVGTVCMDTTMVDVTDVPSAGVGSPVTLIEPRADSPLSATALAGLLGTIAYEVLTGIGRRVRRVYVDGE